MDVFPSNASFFRSSDYWGRFYSNPKLKDFDWYGTLDDFLDSFNRGLACKVPFDPEAGFDSEPAKAVVINVGCGNSMLPFRLRDLGYITIYNLDFCEDVLNDMRAKDRRNSMKWEQIDVSGDGYSSFLADIDNNLKSKSKVIIDKAFLDAYISIGEGECQEVARERAKKYIGTTISFMKDDDVFMIFSLAQDYVVAELVRNLLLKDLYVDIYPLYKPGANKAHMIQFLFLIYRKPPVLLDSYSKLQRKQCSMAEVPNFPSVDFELGSLLKNLRMAKGALYLGSNIQEYSSGRRLTFDIYPKDMHNQVCFTATIYDAVETRGAQMTTAAIIVPSGQEHFWQYSCSEGNEELVSQAKAKRLIILWLKFSSSGNARMGGPTGKGIVNPFDAHFGDDVLMKYIQDHLSDILLKLSLKGTKKVTIIKAGESSAIRAPRRVASSIHAGDIIIHDILGKTARESKEKKDIYIRQMVFSCSPQAVQSELRYIICDNGKEAFIENDVPNEYLTAIVLSMAFLPKGRGILSVLGSGSGALPMLMLRIFGDRVIHAVDLDDTVTEVSKSYFGYAPDEMKRLNGSTMEDYKEGTKLIHISGDAADYIGCVYANQKDIACCIIDINNVIDGSEDEDAELDLLSKDILMSPHPKFLGVELLDKIAAALSNSKGILVINLLTRSDRVKERVLQRLSSRFKWVGMLLMPTDANVVVVCMEYEPQNAVETFTEYVDRLSQTSALSISGVASNWKKHFSVL